MQAAVVTKGQLQRILINTELHLTVLRVLAHSGPAMLLSRCHYMPTLSITKISYDASCGRRGSDMAVDRASLPSVTFRPFLNVQIARKFQRNNQLLPSRTRL